jgi:hypothetical protein
MTLPERLRLPCASEHCGKLRDEAAAYIEVLESDSLIEENEELREYIDALEAKLARVEALIDEAGAHGVFSAIPPAIRDYFRAALSAEEKK